MEQRERRRAENEAVFRAVNEAIVALSSRFGADPIEIVCECSDSDCLQRLVIEREDYEAAREEPTRFLVVPGHVTASIERVVADHGRFVVVEKGGEAAEVASARDPRS